MLIATGGPGLLVQGGSLPHRDGVSSLTAMPGTRRRNEALPRDPRRRIDETHGFGKTETGEEKYAPNQRTPGNLIESHGPAEAD